MLVLLYWSILIFILSKHDVYALCPALVVYLKLYTFFQMDLVGLSKSFLEILMCWKSCFSQKMVFPPLTTFFFLLSSLFKKNCIESISFVIHLLPHLQQTYKHIVRWVRWLSHKITRVEVRLSLPRNFVGLTFRCSRHLVVAV